MALGSVVMWIGVPLGLVYLASKLADSPEPSMGPYLLIIIGLPLGMALVGKALGALNRVHIRVTGTVVDEYRPGWTRSMRAGRSSRSATASTSATWSAMVASSFSAGMTTPMVGRGPSG